MVLKNTEKAIFCIVFIPKFASSNQIFTHMNKRIIYVGTLIDLATIFEPDEEEEEQAEVQINIINEIRYGYEDKN